MGFGVITGWLLAAALFIFVFGYPPDLTIAAAAILIGLSVFLLTKSRNALMTIAGPVMILLYRYLLLPMFLEPMRAEDETLSAFAHFIVSPTILIAFSLLAIVAVGIFGIAWVHHGSAE